MTAADKGGRGRVACKQSDKNRERHAVQPLSDQHRPGGGNDNVNRPAHRPGLGDENFMRERPPAAARNNAPAPRKMCECGSTVFDYTGSCESCGLGAGGRYIEYNETEYRTFADDEDKNADKRRADNAQTPLEVDAHEALGISRTGNRTEADKKRLLRQRQTGALLVKLTERGMNSGMISADECRTAQGAAPTRSAR